MRKLCRLIPATLFSFIIVGIGFFAGSCNSTKNEGFAIYLTKDDVSPAKMEMLSHVDITDKPLISINDIITYNASTHEIKLTDNAYERILKLEVPVQGKSFLVCVNKSPVYWGAFWVGFSSLSFDGITIWKPFDIDGDKVIALTLGYPSPDFYNGHDPRNNATVLNSLDNSGKLINKPSTDKLPGSLKGYELYSWTKDGQWYFTLITGTNRTKTLEEIITDVNPSPGNGWVNIRVTGVDAIKAVLSRLPRNEFVTWLPAPRALEIPQGDINFSLPTGMMMNDIKEHALNCGLNLQIL